MGKRCVMRRSASGIGRRWGFMMFMRTRESLGDRVMRKNVGGRRRGRSGRRLGCMRVLVSRRGGGVSQYKVKGVFSS